MTAKQLTLLAEQKGDVASQIGRATFARLTEQRRKDPTFRLTEEGLTDALRPELAKALPKVARIGKRNVLFDALARGCGLDPDKITRRAAAQVSAALKEIREVDPAVSERELTKTAEAIMRRFDGSGPMAVSCHWSDFEWVRRKANGATHQAPGGPVGWLATLNSLFPESTIARGGMFEITQETPYNWSNLEPVVRDAILGAMK